MSSFPLRPCRLAIGQSLGCDAGSIPQVDRSAALVIYGAASHSRFVPGRICATSATLVVGQDFISGGENSFCLLITLSSFGSLIFLITGTFHPKRWSLSSPCCPALKVFALNFYPLNLTLAGEAKAKVYLHQTALSSP